MSKSRKVIIMNRQTRVPEKEIMLDNIFSY